MLLLTQERALDRIEGRSAVAAEEVARVGSWWGQALIGLFLMVFGVGVIYSLVALSPAVQVTASAAGGSRTIHWLGSAYTPDRGTALIVLVVLAGALGSYLQGVVSFADYVGNRRLRQSWVWWYLLRVFIGSSLALLLYFVILGGLFTADAAADAVNPYGIAAISGLAGLSARNAIDKLREVLDTVFRDKPGERA